MLNGLRVEENVLGTIQSDVVGCSGDNREKQVTVFVNKSNIATIVTFAGRDNWEWQTVFDERKDREIF